MAAEAISGSTVGAVAFAAGSRGTRGLGLRAWGLRGCLGLYRVLGKDATAVLGFLWTISGSILGAFASAAGIRVTFGWGLRAWGLRGCLGLYRVLGKDATAVLGSHILLQESE